MAKKLEPLTLRITAKEDPSVDDRLKSLTIKLKGTGDASRAATVQAKEHAKALREQAEAADKVATEATRAARSLEGADGKKARQAAAALRDQATDAKAAAKAAEQAAVELNKAHTAKIKEAERDFKALVAAEKQAEREAKALAAAEKKTADELERIRVDKIRDAERESKKLLAVQKQIGSELKHVQNEFQKVGESIPGANSMRAFQTGIGGMKAQARDARAALAQLRNAGDGGPYDVGVLRKGANSATALSENLEGARNAGAGVALAGIGGIALSEKLRQAGSDAVESENLVKESFGSSLQEIQKWSEGLQQSLGLNGYEVRKQAGVFNVMFDSMKIGQGDALKMSKSLTELANDMASFYNLSPDEAFTKLRAGIVGEQEPLRSLGVMLSEETTKQYAYAHGIAAVGDELTEQQKVISRYGQIMEQTSKAQGDLSRTMDSPENIRRRTQALGELAAIEIGKGSASAQAGIDNMKASLLQIVGMSPALAQGAGYIGTYGSYATAGIGGLVAFGAQLGQLFLGWEAAKEGAKAAKAAKLEDAAASTVASAANQSLATSQTQAAVAATANTAALEAEATAARGLTLGTVGIVGGVAAVATAFGTWLMSGLYNLAQVNLKIEEQRTLLESVKDGWNSLMDKFTGDSTGAQRVVTQRQLEKSIAQVDAETAESVLKGEKKQEKADADAIEKKRALYEKFAKEQMANGDKENMVANQQKAAQLAQQQKAIAMVPSMPTAPPIMMPTAGTASGVPSGATAAPGSVADADASTVSTGAVALSREDTTSQIRNLEDQKSALKGKANAKQRDALTDQIRALKRHEQDMKKADSAQKKLDREAKRAEKRQDADDLALAKAKSDIESSAKIDDLEEQLAAARERNDDQRIRQLTYQIEMAKAEKQYQDEIFAADQGEPGKHRDTLKEIAKLKFEADKNRADTKADKAAAASQKASSSKNSRGLPPAMVDQVFAGIGGRQIGLGGSPLNPSGSGGTGNRFANTSGSSDYANQAWNYTMGYTDKGPIDISKASEPFDLHMQNGISGIDDFNGRGARAASRGRNRITAPKPRLRETRDGVEVTIPSFKIEYEDPFGGWDDDQ